ncbi:MAG: TerC family protein [Steroidobacteraceae bacterium]
MPALAWLGFFSIYLLLLVADLGVFSRESKVLSVPQALGRTVIWVLVALGFGLLVYASYEYRWFPMATGGITGQQASVQYLTGYILEWSLSVDNIFVIAIIFTYMRIPLQYQYRVLFWGIVGAIVLRGVMIFAGAALIHAFDWTFYAFGAILIYSAARMLKSDDEEFDPGKSVLIKIAKRVYPITEQLDEHRFFTRINGARAATPLFVTLLFVDFADVVFAVDSIPAIFAVTQDPFIVFTSNAFAILGLRSMYFAVAGLMQLFKYLKISLVFVLGFIGIKMLLHHNLAISNLLSLAVILFFLVAGVLASVWANKRMQAASGSHHK